MTTKPKPFDPLSSLFDVPDPLPAQSPQAEEPAPAQMLPAEEAPAPEPPAPEPPAPEPAAQQVDPVALARQLGRAAAARASGPAPTPPASPAPPAPPVPPPAPAKPAARSAASSLMDRAPAPGRQLNVPAASVAAAKAAAAQAAMGGPPRPQAPATPVRPPAPAPAPAPAARAPQRPAPAAPPPKKAGSRLDDFASAPRGRPRSAAEAARIAAEEEARAAAARAAAAAAPKPVAPKPAPPLPPPVAPAVHFVPPAATRPAAPAAPAPTASALGAGDVSRVLAACLPNAQVEVAAVYPVSSPELVRAVWKALRAKLAADGAWDRAVSASAVISALEAGAPLLAVHVKGSPGEFLVWLDTRTGAPVAAFPDAAVYLAGLAG